MFQNPTPLMFGLLLLLAQTDNSDTHSDTSDDKYMNTDSDPNEVRGNDRPTDEDEDKSRLNLNSDVKMDTIGDHSDMETAETESDAMQSTPADSEPRKLTWSGLIDSLEAISQSQTRHITQSASAEQDAFVKPPVFVSWEQDQRLTMEERLEEIQSLQMQLYCTYQVMEGYQAQIGASHSHCTMAKKEAEEG